MNGSPAQQWAAAVAAVLVVLLVISCGTTRNLSTMSARELFTVGKDQYENKQYLKAIERFQAVVYNYPGDAIVDTAQYYLAMSYFRNEDYQLASVEFNRLAINYPSSAYFENAIFMKAVSVFEATPDNPGLDQAELTQAIKLFDDFLIDFPESELREQAQAYLRLARNKMAEKIYKSAIVYDRIRAYEAAKIYFRRIIDDYTNTDYAAPAAYNFALMEYKLKNYAEAQQKFENYMAVFSDHKWLDKAREKAVEAALRNCRLLTEKGAEADARRCWQEFKSDYPENDRIEEADRHIEELNHADPQRTLGEHADT